MTDGFSFEMPVRIVWGSPAAGALAEVLGGLGTRRVLVVTDPGVAATGLPAEIASALGDAGIDAAVHDEVSGNPEVGDVAAVRAAAEEHRSDALAAVGGGSAIDTAKAAAMLLANGGEYADYQWGGRPVTRPSHPFAAVPTTAGTGSEVSRVAVISDPAQPFKKGVASPLMFARAAVLDPLVTVGLPAPVTAATGMDAFVHALEAYTGRRTNPVSDMLALESLRLCASSLERATRDGSDLAARRSMMLAALYGGMAMDQSGLGLVHALSGGLCSHLHLHHGLANALLLPYVAAFNGPAIADDRRRAVNEIMGLDPEAPPQALADAFTALVEALGLPVGLADRRAETAGLDWDAVAEESMRMVMIPNNPRPVTVEDCRSLLDAMR